MRQSRGFGVIRGVLAAFVLAASLGTAGAPSLAAPAAYPPIEPSVTPSPTPTTATPTPTPTQTAIPTATPTQKPPVIDLLPDPDTSGGIVGGVIDLLPNTWVVIRWCRILGPQGSEVDDYRPTGSEADDFGQCRSTQVLVDASGQVHFKLPVTEPGTYQVTITGTSANGQIFTQTLTVVVTLPAVNVKASAVSKYSKFKLRVYTKCKGSGQWTFRVLKTVKASAVVRDYGALAVTKWQKVGGKHKTKGKYQQKTINLKKGTYRALVYGRCGHADTYSNSVTLKK